MKSTTRRRTRCRGRVGLTLAVVAGLALSACSSGGDQSGALQSGQAGGASAGAQSGGDGGAPIHLTFLAERTSVRWVAADVPNFSVSVLDACPSCTVDSMVAESQEQQNQQATTAISQGADVLVVAAIDSAAAAPIVEKAASAGVPVVSYDSLITGAKVDGFVTFDSGRVGEIGAQAVLDSDPAADAVVVVLGGDEASSNAKWVDEGATSVLDGKIEVGYHAWVEGWSGDVAHDKMLDALAQIGDRPLAGVVAANDGIAGGAARALREKGWKGTLPPISGQDAEVAALRRLLSGDQAVTAYKPMAKLAKAAADVALQLGRGQTPSTTTTTDNGAGQVPSVILDPAAVGASDISSTVIADGFTTLDALCAGAASALCAQAGLR